MRPSSKEARAILDAAQHPDDAFSWIEHSFCVGDTAKKLAEALRQRGEDIDVDLAAALGYLHDIGKMVKHTHSHLLDGYEWLMSRGYTEDFCTIALVHHSISNDPFCMIGPPPDPIKDKLIIDCVRRHSFTPEEKLVIFCDSICLYDVMTVDKRMTDIISRYGTGEKTAERIRQTLAFKADLDKRLGQNLYDLFPEVKNNL